MLQRYRRAVLKRDASILRRALGWLIGSTAILGAIAVAVLTATDVTRVETLYSEASASLALCRADRGCNERLWLWIAVAVLALLVLVVLDALRSAVLQAEAEVDDLLTQLAHKDQIIHNQKEATRIDLITRIPNEIAFEADLAAGLMGSGHVIVIIDLVDFARFNAKTTHRQGNDVLRAFAQYIFLHSRRLEKIYRIEAETGESTSKLVRLQSDGSAYRLHRKGDEFLVILEGSELDALGFLNRLRNEVTNPRSPIHAAAGEPIRFYAGICVIDAPEVPPAEYLVYADKCLVQAKLNSFGRRVVWHSGAGWQSMSRDEGEPERAFRFRIETYRSFEEDAYWREPGG